MTVKTYVDLTIVDHLDNDIDISLEFLDTKDAENWVQNQIFEVDCKRYISLGSLSEGGSALEVVEVRLRYQKLLFISNDRV